jgi:hypothetical protein
LRSHCGANGPQREDGQDRFGRPFVPHPRIGGLFARDIVSTQVPDALRSTVMSTENPEGGQPAGQLSPDGNWRWDGHNWVPAHQPPAAAAPQPSQGAPAPYGAPPQQAAQQPYPQQPQQPPHPQQQYGGGMPPGMTPTKKGLPIWAKILIGLVVLFVGLIALLTIVGLTMAEDYADWSCEDVAEEALSIDEDKDEMLSLTDVTELEIAEDNREGFEPPADGRGVVLSCEGTGEWTDLGEAPVLVVLEAGDDGEEWVRYEMVE